MTKQKRPLVAQFDASQREAEQLARLKETQRDELLDAMRRLGWHERLTVWKLLMLIHTVAGPGGVLRWTHKRIAADRFIERSTRSVRDAIRTAEASGLIRVIPYKRHGGGHPLEGLELDRVAVRDLVDQLPEPEEWIEVEAAPSIRARRVENRPETRVENRPENQREKRLENQHENRVENRGPLYTPFSQSTNYHNDQRSEEDDRRCRRRFDFEEVKAVAERIRARLKVGRNAVSSELVFACAAVHVATDWDAFEPAEQIGAGHARSPSAYLRGALRNAAEERSINVRELLQSVRQQPAGVRDG